MAKKGAVKTANNRNGTIGEGGKRLARSGFSRKQEKEQRAAKLRVELVEMADRYRQVMDEALRSRDTIGAKAYLADYVKGNIAASPARKSFFVMALKEFGHKTGAHITL